MMLRIDADQIEDAESFHTMFAVQLGFPEWYGRNMDAWIDCMSHLDDPATGMTTVHVESGQVLSLVIDHASAFKARCPDLFAALLECAAFVNWSRIEAGRTPLIALATNG